MREREISKKGKNLVYKKKLKVMVLALPSPNFHLLVTTTGSVRTQVNAFSKHTAGKGVGGYGAVRSCSPPTGAASTRQLPESRFQAETSPGTGNTSPPALLRSQWELLWFFKLK